MSIHYLVKVYFANGSSPKYYAWTPSRVCTYSDTANEAVKHPTWAKAEARCQRLMAKGKGVSRTEIIPIGEGCPEPLNYSI